MLNKIALSAKYINYANSFEIFVIISLLITLTVVLFGWYKAAK